MQSRRDSGQQPPSWLRWLGNDASRAIIADEGRAPIGCHFFHDQDDSIWEVSLFVSATEVVGGPRDGTKLVYEIQLNIGDLIDLFDAPPSVHWQSAAIADDDDLAQHISLEGTARGHKVWLRILKESPDGTGPGRLLHAQSGELETLW